MSNGTSTTPKILIGASIPRSGHHFVQHLLQNYYEEALFYCEFYEPTDCCKTVPCTRRGEHSVIYQKNHDFDQMLRQDVQDALYVVQYRHPAPASLSMQEMDIALTCDYYALYLAHLAVYYDNFHKKWLARPLSNAVYIDYEMLLQDPVGSLKPIIEWASGSFDKPRLSRVVQEIKSKKIGTDKPFQARVVQGNAPFDVELLGAFESYVIDRCPNFKFARQWPGSFKSHFPFYSLILKIFIEDHKKPLWIRAVAWVRLCALCLARWATSRPSGVADLQRGAGNGRRSELQR